MCHDLQMVSFFVFIDVLIQYLIPWQFRSKLATDIKKCIVHLILSSHINIMHHEFMFHYQTWLASGAPFTNMA